MSFFYKFLTICFLSFLASSNGFADSLFDKNGEIRKELTIHCSKTWPLAPPTPMLCGASRHISSVEGCLIALEMDRARDMGLFISCNPYDKERMTQACPCSCFRNNTRVMTIRNDNEIVWEEIENISSKDKVVSFRDDATVGRMDHQVRDIVYVTHGEERQELYVIHTNKEKPISVTRYHAFLSSDGKMVRALNLKIGEKILDGEGNPVEVIKISREKYFGPIVDLLVKTKSPVGHLLVAEGLIAGDSFWGGIGDEEVNAISFR